MPAASARALTECRRRADRGRISPGPPRPGSAERGRAARAAHKIDKFALHDAATGRRSRRHRPGHARRKQPSGFRCSRSQPLFRRKSLPVPAWELPAHFAGISQIASYSNNLPQGAKKISLATGKNTEIRLAGPGAVSRAGHGSNRVGVGRGRLRLRKVRPNSTSGTRPDEVYARNCTPLPISARYTTR